MLDEFLIEYPYLLAALLSVVLGFAVGFERKTRSKEAGVRTHTIVCFGACLLMIVSKYGFGGTDADVARVAAQIVSGVGFLGAGMIVYRKNAVHGLTTAAGVWATAGIGMACGAGLYLFAVGCTVIMISVQCILHIKCRLFDAKKSFVVEVTFVQKTDENLRIKELFGVKHFQKVAVTNGDSIVWNVTLTTSIEFESAVIDEIVKNNPYILSVVRCDE